MAIVFDEFKELIEQGLHNNMPQEAKLIILGQILYAVTRDELTNQQGWQLEEMLGGREQWKDALSYAIFGNELEDEEHLQGLERTIS
jgi:thiazole synthase